ncbi:MAG: ABC transporter ATP-binding protein [Anaerolineae bacterium]|nr:ABC transporter ATP-binding protein [Anaerolineae bacterium]
MNVIEVENLTRAFNGLRAVDGISFTVGEGEIFGFLGPNGAGKTTTIRVLTGQLRPTAGKARVAGCDVVREREELKPRIGVVFEQQNLYERLSGRENLAFSARLYGVDGQRINEALEQVGLRERGKDRLQHYSNGMKQRLLIARALLHRPSVLFLDEPTRGLDPTMAREIRGLVADLARQGVTIFLTTHYMEEADQLCSRVAFINQGKIVALDTPARLKMIHGDRCVRVMLAGGGSLSLSLDDATDGRRLGELAAAGQVLTLHSAEATLEEVFIRLTGRRLVE